MGIFDIFTGDSAKKAAAENKDNLNNLLSTGTGILNSGQTNALGSLTDAANAYTPLSSLANQYGTGVNMYLNSLGLNGAAGNQAAQNAFQSGPGYQYQVDQSLNQTNRAANAAGMLNGGNTLSALQDRASNLANQNYNQWQTNLAGLVNPQLQATSGAATGIAGADTNKANVYGNTANSLVNLNQNVTNGINSQNTQAANAATAGSGNLWNLGLNAAKLAASL